MDCSVAPYSIYYYVNGCAEQDKWAINGDRDESLAIIQDNNERLVFSGRVRQKTTKIVIRYFGRDSPAPASEIDD